MTHYHLIMDTSVNTFELETMLTQHFGLSPDAASSVAQIFEIEIATTGTAIVKQGGHSNQELLLLGGRAVCSIGDTDGTAHYVGLYEGPCVLPPHISRTKDDVSWVTIEAISSCRIAKASAKLFMDLMVANELVRDWGNAIMRNQMKAQSEHQWALAALKNAERLNWFRRSFPDFEQKFEHWRIASFLGMTPVSFSRARRNKG